MAVLCLDPSGLPSGRARVFLATEYGTAGGEVGRALGRAIPTKGLCTNNHVFPTNRLLE
jgi:hypothetical protein